MVQNTGAKFRFWNHSQSGYMDITAHSRRIIRIPNTIANLFIFIILDSKGMMVSKKVESFRF
jgi:hypothetical protein